MTKIRDLYKSIPNELSDFIIGECDKLIWEIGYQHKLSGEKISELVDFIDFFLIGDTDRNAYKEDLKNLSLDDVTMGKMSSDIDAKIISKAVSLLELGLVAAKALGQPEQIPVYLANIERLKK